MFNNLMPLNVKHKQQGILQKYTKRQTAQGKAFIV